MVRKVEEINEQDPLRTGPDGIWKQQATRYHGRINVAVFRQQRLYNCRLGL